VPIQLAQCWFPGLAISNTKNICFKQNIWKQFCWKLLWFEISKTLIAVLQNKFIVLFIVIFGTLSFPMEII